MALNLNEANARARIKTVIDAVGSEGAVHDYQRWLKDWNELRTLFKVTIGSVDQLRGWMVTLQDMTQEEEAFGVQGDGVVHVRYAYKMIGIMSVDDSETTEKTFVTKTLDVVQALDQDAQLNSGNYEDGGNSYFVSEACQRTSFDYRMFAGVLCHYVEIIKVVEEMV